MLLGEWGPNSHNPAEKGPVEFSLSYFNGLEK